LGQLQRANGRLGYRDVCTFDFERCDANAGVQLEWHQKGIDLELHIAGPYECELWFQDHRQPKEPPVSLQLTDNFSALLKPIELLTTR
jgi:hypothetical protein